MTDFEIVLKNWLTFGSYTYREAIDRIDYLVACGRVAPMVADELKQIAGKYASDRKKEET